jgi:hypothetical protein
MNSLDRLMEFLVAGVFLLIGLRKILSFRRRPRTLGARHRRLPLGLPYGVIVAIGLFEIVAALAIVTPFGPWPQATLVRFAAAGLAVLTLSACFYHARRRESAAPTVALFLLTIFVLVGRM